MEYRIPWALPFFVTACLAVAAPNEKKKAPKEKAPPGVFAGVPNKILDRIQLTWDGIQTFKAQFRQVVFAKRLGTREETQGILYVSKPGKLRWESKTDNSKQILNGNKLTVIQPNKRRGNAVVDIYPDVNRAIDAKPLGFLSGKAALKDLYRVELLSESDTYYELRFISKHNNADSLVAEIDKKSYLLRSLTSETVDSRVRTEFTDTQTNVPIEEKWFEYQPQPSDIVHKN